MKRSVLVTLGFASLCAISGYAQATPQKTPPTAKAAQAPAPKKAQESSPVKTTAEASPLKTQKDKVSYAIGVQIAMSVKNSGIDTDPELVTKAIRDTLSNGKMLMTEDEVRGTLIALQQEVKEKQTQTAAKMGEENKKSGEAFLAENAKKEGVVTLPDGLQYKILKAGDGKKPADTDTVSVNYRGTFTNGTEFDSSISSGKPATFGVTGVIPGFSEVLKLMPVGSKWQVVIPPNLAYGQNGAGGAIGPNATLIFELELVSIGAPDSTPDSAPAPQPAQ